MKKWTTLSSKRIFDDKWLTIDANAYRTPDGTIIDPYYMRQLPNWVSCLAIDVNLDVVMLQHYRPGAKQYLKEVVAGIIESTDATPAEAARRELAEEIGYQGGELYDIGCFWANPAIQNNLVYNFVALGGTIGQPINQDEGETIEIYQTTLPELLADIQRSSRSPQYQGIHISIVLQATNFIKQSSHPDANKLREQLQ